MLALPIGIDGLSLTSRAIFDEKPMLCPGDVIAYLTMCQEEGVSLQRGMNFHLNGGPSVILMSLRHGAPYRDRVEENGKVLIYEGHDVPHAPRGPDPKEVDQPRYSPHGSLTQNGLFFEAAERVKRGDQGVEIVKVYEKIRTGVWVFDGLFWLVDAWLEKDRKRRVFKFKLELSDNNLPSQRSVPSESSHDRLIPSTVKLEVWKRDKGQCVLCDRAENLHFDHIIPYSKGGSSSEVKNIQILCSRHNLAKHDNIE